MVLSWVHAHFMLRIILLKEAICVFQSAGVQTKESPTPVQSLYRNERSKRSAFQAWLVKPAKTLAIICFQDRKCFSYTLNCVLFNKSRAEVSTSGTD